MGTGELLGQPDKILGVSARMVNYKPPVGFKPGFHNDRNDRKSGFHMVATTARVVSI